MANYLLWWITVAWPVAFGITAAEIKTTKLLACSSGSLTLPNEALRNINLTSINEIYWSYRYTHDTEWSNLVYCNYRSMACALQQSALSDGTQVSRGTNGRLIVDHSTQSSSRDHIHFRFEVHWTNGSVDYYIFEVIFTVVCVRTWKDANLNLTRVVYNMYPLEQVAEIEFFDSNGTKFAYINPKQGATINVTDVHRPMPDFWNRLTVTDGSRSLMLTSIKMKDDGREIRAKVHLTALGSKMEMIWIVVDTSLGPPSLPPSTLPSISNPSVARSSSSPPAVVPASSTPSTTVPASSSPSTTVSESRAPTVQSVASSVHRQLWTVILIAVVTFLCTCSR